MTNGLIVKGVVDGNASAQAGTIEIPDLGPLEPAEVPIILFSVIL